MYYVSIEDTFDVIQRAHIATGHGRTNPGKKALWKKDLVEIRPCGKKDLWKKGLVILGNLEKRPCVKIFLNNEIKIFKIFKARSKVRR